MTTWLPSQPDATLIGLPDKQLFDRATEHKRVLMIENIKDFELLRRLAAEEGRAHAGLLPRWFAAVPRDGRLLGTIVAALDWMITAQPLPGQNQLSERSAPAVPAPLLHGVLHLDGVVSLLTDGPERKARRVVERPGADGPSPARVMPGNTMERWAIGSFRPVILPPENSRSSSSRSSPVEPARSGPNQ